MREKISAFWQNFFWQGCQNRILRVHRDNFGEKAFPEKSMFLKSFSDINSKLLGLLSKVFLQGCKKTTFYVSIETF